ncbi:sporulation histidine kinase inhibitor Sda [Bacillus taeanensis]|uniref:Sporulation histidine kinase inhibitor Sda n=1 Tax=Bacillus taeanensis TaxID=273032 RepID=A0A366XR58_9BACI|nr:sporulation histidine kinase inhibitor Sda [Bacillus taeanensis]RBW68622.1 sporulation histidine kinase inhibitor Sda [Bacillus taeanensis]
MRQKLSDHFLIGRYEPSVQLKIDEDFIALLNKEILRGKLRFLDG